MTDTTQESDTPEPTKEDYDAVIAAIRAEQDPSEDPDPETGSEDAPENVSKREARYRIQLRETESERDALRANVEALQRAEVERIAGQKIHKPAALWSTDINLSDLLDDNGVVDPLKVGNAVDTATESLGLAPKRPAGYVGSEGRVVGQPSAPDPWKAAFEK